jgi:hypothetical protein
MAYGCCSMMVSREFLPKLYISSFFKHPKELFKTVYFGKHSVIVHISVCNLVSHDCIICGLKYPPSVYLLFVVLGRICVPKLGVFLQLH